MPRATREFNMKLAGLLAIVLSAVSVVASTPPIVTSVIAQQRYPWSGKVDIVVMFSGASNDVAKLTCNFAATNSTTQAALSIISLAVREKCPVAVGTDSERWSRHYVWDAAADLGEVQIADVAITVEAETPLSGVQLWANGPYWAECNVGASKPEDYGYYFWWGGTDGYKRNASNDGWVSVKDDSSFTFSSDNCQISDQSATSSQTPGYIDLDGNLVAANDAATVHLGATWRMPTSAEFDALISNCTSIWTTRNGVYGRIVTGSGDYASNSIFLPAAGYGDRTYLSGEGVIGAYWSSTGNSDGDDYVCGLSVYSESMCQYGGPHYSGRSIRPLREYAHGIPLGAGTAHMALDTRTNGITKTGGIGDVMGAPDHAFTTGGDADFYQVEDATAPNGSAMRSGVIDNSSSDGTYTHSVLATTVQGPGTVSFQWRSSCEQDDDYELDHAEFAVDGVMVARINGVTSWETVTETVKGAGLHTLTWNYLKNDANSEGEDCVWVADFAWTSAEPYTHESSVSVPYSWIRAQLPHVADEYAAYEAAVNETAANGYSLADCYVAGLAVTNAQDMLRSVIKMVNGEVRISWIPNLNLDKVTRIYTVYGRTDLDEGDWETPVQPWHRFFKVAVAMPTGTDGEETDVADEGFVPQDKPAPGGVQLWANGPYWAECNLGASAPEDYGYYFWWGDTIGYRCQGGIWTDDGFYYGVTWVSSKGTSMSSSPFDPDTCPTMDKDKSALQSLGYIDSTGNLVAARDAARAHRGAPWRMPTWAEIKDLDANCTQSWVMTNGAYGFLMTGKGEYSTKSIFLPAAGYYNRYKYVFDNSANPSFSNYSVLLNYWSSTARLDYSTFYSWSSYSVEGLFFGFNYFSRYLGFPVRPVRDPTQ